jgi:hypothetical protein
LTIRYTDTQGQVITLRYTIMHEEIPT